MPRSWWICEFIFRDPFSKIGFFHISFNKIHFPLIIKFDLQVLFKFKKLECQEKIYLKENRWKGVENLVVWYFLKFFGVSRRLIWLTSSLLYYMRSTLLDYDLRVYHIIPWSTGVCSLIKNTLWKRIWSRIERLSVRTLKFVYSTHHCILWTGKLASVFYITETNRGLLTRTEYV